VRVPQANGLIPTRNYYRTAVDRAKRDSADVARVPLERLADWLTRARIPQPNGLIFLWLELVLAAARITRLTPLVGFHISCETTELGWKTPI
jgi:hypothetical protein